jgi:hypothetical protein
MLFVSSSCWSLSFFFVKLRVVVFVSLTCLVDAENVQKEEHSNEASENNN